MPHTPQAALLHPPGEFSALTTWRLAASGSVRWLRESLGGFLKECAAQQDVHALVGLQAGLPELALPAAVSMLPRGTGPVRFPSTQADVLVQLSAPSREALLRALRALESKTRDVLRREEEVLGGRIGEGREPFGWRDPLVVPTLETVRTTALVPEGPHAGGSWLLYLRFQQDVARFSALPESMQVAAMGQGREGQLLENPPEHSHVRRMRESGAGGGVFIRRGFPFRQTGEEGLAFVAAARDPEAFSWALDAMLGGGSSQPDALLRYATPVGGGLYFSPTEGWFR